MKSQFTTNLYITSSGCLTCFGGFVGLPTDYLYIFHVIFPVPFTLYLIEKKQKKKKKVKDMDPNHLRIFFICKDLV
jgi:hypothetical protein